jgi:DNA polymerase III subunit alpha
VGALAPILDETHGVILYQEQVMRICVDIAGFSMPEADKVRKIIAKTSNQQDPIGLSKVYHSFAEGYLAKGHPKAKLAGLWDKILACQRYVLCKSHSTAYAYIAYANMYLKTHWPLQYMCAALQTKNRELFVNECRRLNIDVLPPDINKSQENFCIEGDSIRIGLSNIKNVGRSAKIIKGQPYTDEFDFVDRAKPRKKALQFLIYAGALDMFDDRANLISVFCQGSRGTSIGDMANYEKEAIGYYVSMDPLEKYKDQLRDCIKADERPLKCKLGGLILRVHVHQAKTGPMCFVSLLIEGGEVDTLIWPSNFAIEYPKLGVGNVITASAKLTPRGSFAIRDIKVIGATDQQVVKTDQDEDYLDIAF